MNEQIKKRLLAFKKSTDTERLKPGKVAEGRYDDGNKKHWGVTESDKDTATYLEKVTNTATGAVSYKPSDVLTPDNHITQEQLDWQKNHPHTTDSYEKRIDIYKNAYSDPALTNFKADQPNLGERVIASIEELESSTYSDVTGESNWFSNKINDHAIYLVFSGANSTVKGEISTNGGATWTEVQSGVEVRKGYRVKLTPTAVSSPSGASVYDTWVGAGSLPSESIDPTTHVLTFTMPNYSVDLVANYTLTAEFVLFTGGSDFTSLGLSYDAPTGSGLQYYDGSGWVSTGNTIPVTNGYVCVRGKNFTYLYSFTGNFTSVSGNMAYLLDYDCDPSTALPTLKENQFYSTAKDKGLFQDCTTLTNVSALTLPFTSLAKNCYKSMFKNCTYLLNGIASLPATVISESAYENMFYGCRYLTSAPDLTKSTSLGVNSCQCMFYTCYNLSTVTDMSSVSATYKNCCNNMFAFCTSLKTAPSFSTACETLNWSSCEGMYRGCTALEKAPDLSHVITLDCAACKQMFEDCTALKTAPSLSAVTSLNSDGSGYAANCMAMFKGSGIISDATTSAPWFSTSRTLLPSNACNEMFRGCKSMAVAPDMSHITQINDYACHYMFEGCTLLNEAAEMNLEGIGEEGCAYMYSGSGITSAKKALGPEYSGTANLAVGVRGCKDMFSGCSSLVVAPDMRVIPYDKISTDAFVCMFQNCSNLFGIIYLPQVVFSSSFNPTVNMFTKAGTIHDSKGEYAYMYYVKGTGRNGWNYFNSGIDSDHWSVKEISS